MPYTIKTIACHESKTLRSRFICHLYPAANTEEAREQLSEHCKRFSDATHNCYAYICGLAQEITYYSDAGEPGGTAGKPMLNAMLRADLCNCLAVVTRYYGGIKLGVKGLIEAYGSAVELCIETAELVLARQMQVFRLCADYQCYESLKHRSTELEAEFSEVEYAGEVSFTLALPVEKNAELQEILSGYVTQNRLHYID